MVDCTSLENWSVRKGTVSSNLTPSAFGPPKRTYGVTKSAKVREGDLNYTEVERYYVLRIFIAM